MSWADLALVDLNRARSPKRRRDGSRNQFYDFMRDVSPGDIVFSYCDTLIKAIGVVTGKAQTGPKPDFGNVGVAHTPASLARTRLCLPG